VAALIKSLSKAGRPGAAIRIVLRDALADPSLDVDEITWGTAITAAARNSRPRLALRTFYRSPAPSVQAYGAAMDALSRTASEWSLAAASELLKHLEANPNILPADATVVYNAAVTTAARVGDWATAQSTVRRMQDRCVPTDTYTYNSLIAASRYSAAPRSTVRTLMSRFIPDAVSYNAALSALAGSGDLQGSLDLLAEAARKGINVTTVSAGAVG